MPRMCSQFALQMWIKMFVWIVLRADPAGGGRAAPGHAALGRALARRAAAATHACAAEDPAAGGRGQEGPEQQHTAEVRPQVLRTWLFISHAVQFKSDSWFKAVISRAGLYLGTLCMWCHVTLRILKLLLIPAVKTSSKLSWLSGGKCAGDRWRMAGVCGGLRDSVNGRPFLLSLKKGWLSKHSNLVFPCTIYNKV